MNVSGHLLSTAQIESALVEHEAVTEAAVVSWSFPVQNSLQYRHVTLHAVAYFTYVDAVYRLQYWFPNIVRLEMTDPRENKQTLVLHCYEALIKINSFNLQNIF